MIPALLALPSKVLTAASTSAAVRSGSLILAISSSCALVTFPTFKLLGVPLPFFNHAAFFIRIEAGVVLIIKSKDLSS